MSKPESSNVIGGHVSIRPEGTGPRDSLFTFQTQQKRFGGAVGISAMVHVAVIVLLVVAVRFVPDEVIQAVLPERLNVVFLPSPGPGGGGGGGNKMPDPPKPAEIPKTKPPEPVPQEIPQEVAPPSLVLALTTPVPNEPAPGTLADGPPDSVSRGTGTGSGAGPGTGSGLGPGSGGGFGGGVFRIGNGVSSPIPIKEIKPQYTAEAMRAKVQGEVWIDCVVMPDGTVTDIEIVRSLDSSFGLDQEAIKAARQWRFRPGTRQGQPVPVRITIALTFTLR